ncbi:MAG TPA: hypothetical protein VLM38_11680 [Blastocatellia bacterium]|nr:hypothetical protein [Blastocatellia bacterium]
MSTQTDVVAAREETARAGERIYEQRLKAVLEPDHKGRVVAVHIPSEDYFLGDSLLEASDRLRDKYPHAARGDVYARGVGERALIRARTPRVTRTQR